MEHLKEVSFGQALALLRNNRLCWLGLPGTNTLTFNEHLQITAVKSFITSAPEFSDSDDSEEDLGVNVIKLVYVGIG